MAFSDVHLILQDKLEELEMVEPVAAGFLLPPAQAWKPCRRGAACLGVFWFFVHVSSNRGTD